MKKPSKNIRVDKFRVIILLEDDSNTYYKIIFNSQIMINLEASDTISNQIIDSRRLQAAATLSLNLKTYL